MPIDNLFSKRILFVSGKGGVGKTSVSILLALAAEKQKKRTLIVEMNSLGRVASHFDSKPIGYKETPVSEYISCINLDPKKCFEEYVIKHIRFKAIYKTFFNNKFVTNFLDAVPGLNDVLMLGKIFELERQQKHKSSDSFDYDLIIVDAPATGHGLSCLEVPKVLKEAVKIGPLHSHAVSILDLLGDHQKTAFCLVTLAEEMPVAESLEYVQAIKERTELSFGPLFINSLVPPVPPIDAKKDLDDESQLIYNFYRLTNDRAALNKEYLEKIKKQFKDFDLIELPFQFQTLKQSKDFKPLLTKLTEANT